MSQVRLDGMSIFIERDRENGDSIDYWFVCDVYEPDPRYKSRFMCSGQRRGLFRVSKSDQSAELLFPMEHDVEAKRFRSAAAKVVALYEAEGKYPERTQYASG